MMEIVPQAFLQGSMDLSYRGYFPLGRSLKEGLQE
jgi:hypothetical protein